MTPLQIKNEIVNAIDCAARNGFTLDIGNQLDIIANRDPYAKGAIIKTLPNFSDVITFFKGYEQMQLEQRELDREKK